MWVRILTSGDIPVFILCMSVSPTAFVQLRSFLTVIGLSATSIDLYVYQIDKLSKSIGGLDGMRNPGVVEAYFESLPAMHARQFKTAWNHFRSFAASHGQAFAPLPTHRRSAAQVHPIGAEIAAILYWTKISANHLAEVIWQGASLGNDENAGQFHHRAHGMISLPPPAVGVLHRILDWGYPDPSKWAPYTPLIPAEPGGSTPMRPQQINRCRRAAYENGAFSVAAVDPGRAQMIRSEQRIAGLREAGKLAPLPLESAMQVIPGTTTTIYVPPEGLYRPPEPLRLSDGRTVAEAREAAPAPAQAAQEILAVTAKGVVEGVVSGEPIKVVELPPVGHRGTLDLVRAQKAALDAAALRPLWARYDENGNPPEHRGFGLPVDEWPGFGQPNVIEQVKQEHGVTTWGEVEAAARQEDEGSGEGVPT